MDLRKVYGTKAAKAADLAHSIISQRRDRVMGTPETSEFWGTHSTWTITEKQADYLLALGVREGEIYEATPGSEHLYFSLEGLEFTKYDKTQYSSGQIQFCEMFEIEILGLSHDDLYRLIKEQAERVEKFVKEGKTRDEAIRLTKEGKVLPAEEEAEVREAEKFLEGIAPGSTDYVEVDELRTLISTPTYESIEFTDGRVEISVTMDGGATWHTATVHKDGRVEGGLDDLKIIVAECRELPFEDVEHELEESGVSLEEWIASQATNDCDVADLKAEMEADSESEAELADFGGGV